MDWNFGYFDSNGNQIMAYSESQEVFDEFGKSVGYFSNGVIRGHNGNILSVCPYFEETEDAKKSVLDEISDFFDPFKPFN